MQIRSYAPPRPRPSPHVQCLWAITGDDPCEVSAHQVAMRCNRALDERTARQPHLVWNPVDDAVIEMISADQDCWLTNTGMYTVLVVATEKVPFTEYGTVTEPFLHFPDTIPDAWPLGPPTRSGPGGAPPEAGHYATSQAGPYERLRHPFVGAIDITKIRRSS